MDNNQWHFYDMVTVSLVTQLCNVLCPLRNNTLLIPTVKKKYEQWKVYNWWVILYTTHTHTILFLCHVSCLSINRWEHTHGFLSSLMMRSQLFASLSGVSNVTNCHQGRRKGRKLYEAAQKCIGSHISFLHHFSFSNRHSHFPLSPQSNTNECSILYKGK